MLQHGGLYVLKILTQHAKISPWPETQASDLDSFRCFKYLICEEKSKNPVVNFELCKSGFT